MPSKKTDRLDHLLGSAPAAKRPRTTGQPPGRPVLGEGRKKLTAAVSLETWRALNEELHRRKMAGARVTVGPDLDRMPHAGDLIDEAVAGIVKAWAARSGGR